MSKDEKRWRAEKGGVFYSLIFLEISHSFMVEAYTELYDDLCDSLYKKGNYFRTKEEAQTAADDMQKVLLRQAGELRDFTWALEQMKQGKSLNHSQMPRRDYFYLEKDDIVYFELTNAQGPMCYKTKFRLTDIEATDWEIYQGE